MKSLIITPHFICGLFLLLVTIASSRKLHSKPKNEVSSGIPDGVTIERVTGPFDQSEGPHWDHRIGKLYFVDSYEQKIFRLDPATGELTYTYIANGPVGAVVPVEGELDKFVAGAGKELVLITWDSDKNCTKPIIKVLGTVERNKIGTHFNDGKADSHGRFWTGTMGGANASAPLGITPNQASFYRLTSDGKIKKEISPVSISNGLTWNKADTKFYYIDTTTLQIAAYDFDARLGKISNKRIAFDFSSHNISGAPDGMTIDINDNLWIAARDGQHVINVDPVRGRLIRSIRMPVNRVSSVIWGGNSFDILYVTSARNNLTPAQIAAQPESGSIFAVKGLGVRGRVGNLFFLHKKSDRFYQEA